ncbi:alpha/beta hydrolase [Paenibacillus sp. MWE-103]|uniref:Alpha/beta hydrolase n=1 Tax=Paenibacillus artemisiicola TaxID=1172618 RepID=A0ABS3WGB5_9BACL|nr:alpha/beta hydrolase [Paenibacillus artemisiicola]MBO7747337.1 alpha/beta hydrolase [Paenibacillus artemisiicola]
MAQILFVPGIKGTELFEKDRKVWFPKNPGDITSLSIHNELSFGNPIRIVNAFQIQTVEVYKGVLDAFGPDELTFFTYDWRHDIRRHIDRLKAKIIELANDYGPITLVAHSMGGMLAKLAILALDELGLSENIERFVTLGTPWLGSADAYKALTYGEPGIFPKLYHLHNLFTDKDSQWLARQFPSVYQLLPSEAYFAHEDGKFISNDKEEDSLYINALQSIQKQYIESGCDPLDVYNTYIKPVHDSMLKPIPDNIIHDCLIGTSFPTIYQVPEQPTSGLPVIERILFKKDVIFKNGDGVVPVFSAYPSHVANVFYISAQHHEMASNHDVIEFIKWSISNKTGEKPEALLDRVSENLNNGFMAKIKCPVDTTILDQDGKYLAGEFDSSIEQVSPFLNETGVLYYGIGESKYVFFPESVNEDVTVKVNSYQTGIADISVDYFDPDVSREIKFEPLPVTKGEAATITIPVRRSLEEAKLVKSNQEELGFRLQDLPMTTLTQQLPSLSKLKIKVNPARGEKKSSHRLVFSGDVVVDIKADSSDIDDLYFVVDDNPPVQYSEENRHLSLLPGEHTLRAFAKDIYGRPVKPVNTIFNIDSILPETRLLAIVKPDVLELSFETQTLGSRASTYYRIMGRHENEWKPIGIGETDFIEWGRVDIDPKEFLEIQFYSKNEFGNEEQPKSVKLSLRSIPGLMWGENPSIVTPETVWHNLFHNNEFDIILFTPSFISRVTQKTDYGTVAPDDVKGIRLDASWIQVDVMYAEKYALYFVKPPTEVLEVGQSCTFSFELLTERTNERIQHTAPRARLHPLRAGNVSDTQLAPLINKDGIFYGEFTVGAMFLQYKFKLIITDARNTTPALREISLIMKELDEEEENNN